MSPHIISPSVQAGTRDPAATADGKRIVNCPVKGGEPIASIRCLEQQADGCYCPSAPGALAGAAELLEMRAHRKNVDDPEESKARQRHLVQLKALKERAAELGPTAYAGPAASARRSSAPPPTPGPDLVAPSPAMKAGRHCSAGCGRSLRSQKGKSWDKCALCRVLEGRTKWRACPNASKGCGGRLRPDNNTGLCRRCVHGRAIAPKRKCSKNCGRRLQKNSVGDVCYICRLDAGQTNRNKIRDERRRAKAAIAPKPFDGARHLTKLSTRELANLLGAVKSEIASRNAGVA